MAEREICEQTCLDPTPGICWTGNTQKYRKHTGNIPIEFNESTLIFLTVYLFPINLFKQLLSVIIAVSVFVI